MLNVLKMFYKVILITVVPLMLLQGCALLVVPIEYIRAAGKGNKDVSCSYERREVIGREYELLQDVYLTQYLGEENLSLDRYPPISIPSSNPQLLEICTILEVIPKGTRFRVDQVIAKTSFGEEVYVQFILASLLDEQGNRLSTINSAGNRTLVKVNSLFQYPKCPNQEWVFVPKAEVIHEVETLVPYPRS